MERNKKYFMKGAGILLITAILVLTSIAVTANTMDEREDAAISLIDSDSPEMNVKSNQETKQCGVKGVLWDNGLPDGRNGCSCVLSSTLNREVIDDFTVPEGGWSICDGHFRIVTYSGLGPEAINGVNVFFYKSTGPCEPDIERYEEREAEFNAYLTGDTYFERPEIAVDCQFDCVDLTAGEWWVCFQPVLTENCFWLTTVESECSIYYFSADYPKWTWGFDVFADFYDVSFKLTGPAAKIICDPVGMNFGKAKAGDTVTGQIYVCNEGTPGSLLNWHVDTASVPSWGTWTFTPSSGTGLAKGDCEIVDVTCVLTKTQGNYTGDITIFNSDEPTDFCKVATSVEVPRDRSHNAFFWNLLQQFPALYQIVKILLGA